MSRSWANLISANDLDTLSTALRRMQPLTLARELDGTELTVSVRPAHPSWNVAMVVQVRVKEGRVEWVQTFESMEKARLEIERFCKQTATTERKQKAGAQHDSYITTNGATP